MKSNTVKWLLGILQVFIGIGAVPVGLMMIIDPSGPLPIEMLEGSPFPNFLIPGIVLFSINGVGSLIGAVLTFRQHAYAGLVAIGLGAFLMVWIVMQVWWLGPPIHWLQVLYFVLGAAELGLGWMLDPGAVRRLIRAE
ncbi:MAG: hypothetical protein R3C44_07360 [Chloroflexota bacterium]